jgi:hypothetical protein
MTEYERQLLSERKFHDLVQYQIKIDADIEAQVNNLFYDLFNPRGGRFAAKSPYCMDAFGSKDYCFKISFKYPLLINILLLSPTIGKRRVILKQIKVQVEDVARN